MEAWEIVAQYLETTDGKVVVWVENTKGVMVDDVFDATATNKESLMRAVDMWEIKDGKITDRWSVMDVSKRSLRTTDRLPCRVMCTPQLRPADSGRSG